MKKLYNKLKEYIPVPVMVITLVLLLSLILLVAFVKLPHFSDWFNRTVGFAFRFVLGKITYLLPFSLGEFIILSLPITIFLTLRVLYRYMDNRPHGFTRSLFCLFGVVGVLASLFILDFAPGYHGTAVDEKMGIESVEITEENLKETALYTVGKINGLVGDISFDSDGSSFRGYSHGDTVSLAYESYCTLSDRYSFITNFKAPVKQLAVSKLMTYTHISGVYSYYTGEANLNYNYPEFVNVYTIAHEMAHQRGISRENEANFIAYLVCTESDDEYMQYSGYLTMLEYLTDALGQTSTQDVIDVYSALDMRAFKDLVNYSNFFAEYSDNVAADVTDTINDAHLKLQGTEGTVSYGKVVELVVSYYEQNKA